MEKFDLLANGLEEMSFKEMKETEGGLLLIILAICATAALVSSCGFVDYKIHEGTDRVQTNPAPDSTCIDQSIH